VRKELPRPNQTGEHWHMRTEPQSIGGVLGCTHGTAAVITLVTFFKSGCLCNKDDGQHAECGYFISTYKSFPKTYFSFWSRETEVGIVIMLETRKPSNRTSITGGVKDFILLQKLQIGSTAHSSSYKMGTGGRGGAYSRC